MPTPKKDGIIRMVFITISVPTVLLVEDQMGLKIHDTHVLQWRIREALKECRYET